METINIKEKQQAIKNIEKLTYLYNLKRISTTDYQRAITENLFKLESKRDYAEYLKNIGQPYPITQ